MSTPYEVCARMSTPHDDPPPPPHELDLARVVTHPDELSGIIARATARGRPRHPDPDRAEDRTAIAWRIIRECARLQRWIEPDEALADLDEDTYWDTAPIGPRAISMRSIGDLEVEMGTKPVPALPINFGPALVRMDIDAAHALLQMPLLPHAVPEDLVPRWTTVIIAISSRLRFEKESPDALREILGQTVGGVKASWPTKYEVLIYEESLVNIALGEMLSSSRKATRGMLLELGLNVREVRIIESLAKRRARDLTNADLDEKRAMMELAMEDLVSRCRASPDEKRTELMGLKALSVVQGIAKADIEDDDAIFARVVQKGARVRDTQGATLGPSHGPPELSIDAPLLEG